MYEIGFGTKNWVKKLTLLPKIRCNRCRYKRNRVYLFRNSRQLLAPVGIGCVGRARGPRPEGDGHARLLHRRSIPGTHFSFRAKYICASFLQNLHLYLFLQRFRVRSPTSPTYVNNQFHYPVRSDCAGTAAGPPSSSTTFCPVISAGDSSTLRSGT